MITHVARWLRAMQRVLRKPREPLLTVPPPPSERIQELQAEAHAQAREPSEFAKRCQRAMALAARQEAERRNRVRKAEPHVPEQCAQPSEPNPCRSMTLAELMKEVERNLPRPQFDPQRDFATTSDAHDWIDAYVNEWLEFGVMMAAPDKFDRNTVANMLVTYSSEHNEALLKRLQAVEEWACSNVEGDGLRAILWPEREREDG